MFRVRSLRYSVITITAIGLLSYITNTQAGPLELSDGPIFLEVTRVPPNILFLVDDSGSMDWEVLTKDATNDGRFTGNQPDGSNTNASGDIKHRDSNDDGVKDCNFNKNGQSFYGYIYGVEFGSNTYGDDGNDCNTADDEAWRFRNYNFNPLYFDPNKTYLPWAGVDENGQPFIDMDIHNAKDNPYENGSPTIDLTRHNSNWLGDTSRAESYREGGSEPDGFRYYTWSDNNGNGQFDNGEQTEHLIRDSDPATQTNFANWFSYHRSREYTAKAAYGHTVAALKDVRVGLATLNNNRNVNTKIKSMNPEVNFGNKKTLLDKIYSINSSSGTPLRQMMYNSGRYFECKSDNGIFVDCPILSQEDGGSCQQNFLVAMTDGFYNGSFKLKNTDKDGDGPWDGGAYGDEYENTLADIAMHFYERDLNENIDNHVPIIPNVDDAQHQHVVTYNVAFGVNGTLNSNPPNKVDDFDWPNPNVGDRARKIDDLRHAAYNGRGEFLSVTDPTQLVETLKGAIKSIADRTSSSASVALNSGAHRGESQVFQAIYNTGDWTGQLLIYSVKEDGSIGSLQNDASKKLNEQDWKNGRNIVTYNNDSRKGIPFQWNQLTPNMQYLLNLHSNGMEDDLGQHRLEYIRGRRDKEDASGYNFRIRHSVLGDLINSAPYFVGIPPYVNGIGTGYATFREMKEHRPAMIYVGGNDGMLHAFDAKSGKERFAYIPTPVFDKLNDLTNPNYKHLFYVDGSVTVADAQFGSCGDCWRSILAGGLRSGGQGIYALDVTDPPALPSDSPNEQAVASKVLWEFTDRDDRDLGYTFSSPSIVKMSNKRWAVIFGNGYNNTEDSDSNSTDDDDFKSVTGKAALYILFIEEGLDGNWKEGSDYIKIVVESGSPDDPNGLATPSAIDVDGDFDADFIYAGDLKGNLWRFDVTSENIEDWSKKEPKSIFIATSLDGNSQSITIQPQGRRHPQCKGAMIYFGTGKYLEASDHDTNIPTQTFYGIWDAEAVTDKSKPGRELCGNSFGKPLLKQTITDYGSELRLTSNEEIKWEEHSGWRVDLPTVGERVISQPLLRGLNILFTTNIPSPEACSFGGTSWLMVLDAESGGGPDNSFDLTNDSEINEDDKLSRGNGSGEDNQKVAASGKKFEGGFSSSPAVLHANNYGYDHTYIGGADGKIRNQKSKNDDKAGRMAWRQDYAK